MSPGFFVVIAVGVMKIPEASGVLLKPCVIVFDVAPLAAQVPA